MIVSLPYHYRRKACFYKNKSVSFKFVTKHHTSVKNLILIFLLFTSSILELCLNSLSCCRLKPQSLYSRTVIRASALGSEWTSPLKLGFMLSSQVISILWGPELRLTKFDWWTSAKAVPHNIVSRGLANSSLVYLT